MLIYTTMLLAANQLSLNELESAWWDCDTLYQQDKLINQKYLECVKINNAFRNYFPDDVVFMQYWRDNKEKEYFKRGYKHIEED